MSAVPIDSEPVARPATRLRGHHRTMLYVALAIVALALLLEVRADQRVAFSFLPEYPLPETCQSRSLLGVDCPGCGLTRSLVFLAHGRLRESAALHPLGWLMAAVIVLQIPYRLVALLTHDDAPLGTRFPKLFGTTLIVLLVVTWLVRVALRMAG